MDRTETIIFAVLFVLIVGTVLISVLGKPAMETWLTPRKPPVPSTFTPNNSHLPLKSPELPGDNTQKWKTNPKYCESDEDCVITTLSCCPCNMGGKPVCVNKYYAQEFRKNLSCDKGIVVCPAVYLCDEVTACACVNHTCVPV